MEIGTWWGIKFLDRKFLRNIRWSPSIEVFRDENGYRIKLSGHCEIEPGLSKWQIEELKFLGWDSSDNSNCDCYLMSCSTKEELSRLFERAIQALYFIYGVAEDCHILGSHYWVAELLQELDGIKKVKGYSMYRLENRIKPGNELK